MTAEPFGVKALTTASLVATALAYRSIRKKSLTKSGATAGFVVGFAMVATGMRGLILFYFYQVGTWATRYKMTRKIQLDGSVQEAAVRGAGQVLCVSVLATVLSLWHAVVCGVERPVDFHSEEVQLASSLTCGILAHHATSLADTLASEMGILAKGSPVLITRPWQRVPAGTNGGVTMEGTLWSLLGGILIGCFYVATDAASGTLPVNGVATIAFGGVCGVIGSMVDSLVGASLQATYYDIDEKKVYHADAVAASSSSTIKHICGLDILTNEQVNLISVVATTYIGGWVLGPWFFPLFQ
jgi:uncharacterized protein (TIGR00297 family)